MKNLFKKLKRSIEYAIQGWGSEDYDFYHIISDLVFKLDRVKNHLTTHSIIDDSELLTIKSRMETISGLFTNLYLKDREYTDEADDYLDKKYGELTFENIPYEKGGLKYTELKSNRAKVTSKNVGMYDKERHQLYKLAQIKEEKDKKLAWKLLQDNIETFWD